MKSDKWIVLDAVKDEKGRIILTPHSQYDYERLEERMKNGRGQFKAQLSWLRSLPQLRLYWPWVRKVLENCTHFVTERHLHKALLTASGVVEPYLTIDGEIHLMPSSIAFEEMDQEEFNAYFDKAQQIVTESIVPGVDLDQLMSETKKACGWQQHPNNEKRPRLSAEQPTNETSTPSSAPSPTPS